MEHEVFVPVVAEALRKTLRDPSRVARCVPGLQQDADESAGPLSGRLKVRIGGHTITYRGVLTLVERDGVFTAEGEGTEARGTGSAKLTLALRLTETPDGTTLSFTGGSRVEGRLAELAPETVTAAAHRLLDRLAARLGEVSVPAETPDTAETVETGETPETVETAGAADAAGAAEKDDAAGVSGAAKAADGDRPGPPPSADAAADPLPKRGSEEPDRVDDVDSATDEADGATAADDDNAAAADDDADGGVIDPKDAVAEELEDDLDDADLEADADADADDRGDDGRDADDRGDDDLDVSVFEVDVPSPSLDGETISGEGDFIIPDEPPAEAAHARRTMIGRSAEEVDHAPPRGRYAPVPAPDSGSAGATLRWVAPAAALALASAVVVGRALRRRK
ncbi:SRPBCC domain-containing protein [Streptomyces sp. NPDC002018]|uniref:SRPBCC domain-containing protein n=1 Tax=Streptomyces sp. NPDC002018 TaxID=3364629 RepID=UPI0036BA1131